MAGQQTGLLIVGKGTDLPLKVGGANLQHSEFPQITYVLITLLRISLWWLK